MSGKGSAGKGGGKKPSLYFDEIFALGTWVRGGESEEGQRDGLEKYEQGEKEYRCC